MGYMKEQAIAIEEAKQYFPFTTTVADRVYGKCFKCDNIFEVVESGYGVDKDALWSGRYDNYYYKCPHCGTKINY